MADTRRLGDVATRVLFENERVKVWEMLLEPGESSDPHRHTMDYLLCVIEGESVDADRPDGTSFHLPVEPGDVFYIPRGGVETAVNRSGARYREILIELK
jgi:quercetin dioxygenase-like cupin family protein